MRKKLLAISIATAMALSIAGCGGGGAAEKDAAASSETTSAASEAEAPKDDATRLIEQGEDITSHVDAAITEKPAELQEGSVFTMWLEKDFPAYLPWMDTSAMPIMLNCYDNLLYKYHQDINDVRGACAETWEVSDDGLVWTFNLREGLKFANGNDVTAEDFVKSWDAAKPYAPRMFQVVESYEAVDDLTLVVTLNAPSPTFIYELPMQYTTGVVDSELLEKYGPESNEAAIGCGPYYVAEYSAGEKFVLKANPYYSIEDKMPCIETINLEIIPEGNTAMMAFMGGEIQGLSTNNMEIVETLKASGYDLAKKTARSQPWWLNAKETEIFRDAAVREGLCHIIDWEAINELVYNGEFEVLESFWADGPGGTPYGENYSHDVELGIQMIKDAGYALEDIAFVIECNPQYTNEVTAMVAQFNEAGLTNVTMETYDLSACFGMLKSGTYHCTTTFNGYSIESPLTPYLMGLPQDGSQRIVWLDYMDEDAYAEALEHYNAALQCTDFDSYVEEVTEITRICQDNNVALGGLESVSYYAIAPEYSGVYSCPTLEIEFCYMFLNNG